MVSYCCRRASTGKGSEWFHLATVVKEFFEFRSELGYKIPEGFTGALCKCYTETIITKQYRELQLAMGNELPRGAKVHVESCRVHPDSVNHLKHNSTHCYSLLGECYREDDYDRKDGELHNSGKLFIVRKYYFCSTHFVTAQKTIHVITS